MISSGTFENLPVRLNRLDLCADSRNTLDRDANPTRTLQPSHSGIHSQHESSLQRSTKHKPTQGLALVNHTHTSSSWPRRHLDHRRCVVLDNYFLQFYFFCSGESRKKDSSDDLPGVQETEETHVRQVFERLLNIASDAHPAHTSIMSFDTVPKRRAVTDPPEILVTAVHARWAAALAPLSRAQISSVRYVCPPPRSSTSGALARNCQNNGTIDAESVPEYRRQGFGLWAIHALMKKTNSMDQGRQELIMGDSQDLGGGALGWNWMDTDPDNEAVNRFFTSLVGKENMWSTHWTYMHVHPR